MLGRRELTAGQRSLTSDGPMRFGGPGGGPPLMGFVWSNGGVGFLHTEPDLLPDASLVSRVPFFHFLPAYISLLTASIGFPNLPRLCMGNDAPEIRLES